MSLSTSPLNLELRRRLRRLPTPVSVEGSLPVLFFGNALHAQLLTVGLNPSDQEYVDARGVELNGMYRRFQTLSSLGATSRDRLTDSQCDQAIEMMTKYFGPGRPVFGWFRPLARVVGAMGLSFQDGTAAHIDLIQEATSPVWAGLSKQDQAILLAADAEFLSWQISAFPAGTLACNGATVLQSVCDLTKAQVVSTGRLGRVRWTVACSRNPASRVVGIVGWNYPLTRPTGLGADGERELGGLLSKQLSLALDGG
jgi:hypothetical protein